MPFRVLVAGGLRDPGNWDSFARSVGEELAKAGLALSMLSDSPFGKSVADGYLKAQGSALRVHGPDAPSALADRVVASAGDPVAEAAREADVVLLAGHGGNLRPLASHALARHVPLVALPIPRTTSEEIWEENLAHVPRIEIPIEVRTAILNLRKLDARSRQSAATFAALLGQLAAAPDRPGGPRVLVVAPPPAAAMGEDTLDEVLRRGLRAVSPGCAVERAGPGWMRAPGRGFFDAARIAGVIVVDLAAGPIAAYTIGLARGAGRPVVALLRRGEAVDLDPRSLDATIYDGDRDLARVLEHGLARAIGRHERPRGPRRETREPRGEGRGPRAQAPAEGAPRRKRGRRRGRGGGREPSADASGEPAPAGAPAAEPAPAEREKPPTEAPAAEKPPE